MESLRSRIVGSLPQSWQMPLYHHLQRVIKTREVEMDHLGEYVDRQKLAIDVGANKGVYTYALSRLAASVFAFEPQPKLAELITAYRHNIQVYEVALSNKSGQLELHIPSQHGILLSGLATLLPVSGEFQTITVPVRTLDSYNFENIGFIKIDVEGNERDTLEGAEQLLKKQQPNLLIEIEQRHLHFPMDEIFTWLHQRGYSGFFYFAGQRRPLSEFSYELYQQPYLEDVIHGRDANIRGKYVNNFFFVPKNN